MPKPSSTVPGGRSSAAQVGIVWERASPLLFRAPLLLIGAYALLIGGTFTGITVVRLQRISLGLLSGVALAWLIALWRSPRSTRPGAPFGALFGVWGAVFGLSLAASFSGRSLIALWYMALYAGLWLLLSDLRQRGVSGAAFSDVLIVAALPVVFWAAVQVLPWFPRWWAVRDLGPPFYPARPVGTFGNPNLLGAFLALALPFGLARAFTLPDRVGRGLMAIWAALVLGTLYLTYSRGAWLGAACGLAVFGLIAIWRQRDGVRAWARGSRRVRGAALASMALGVAALALGARLTWRAFASPQRETGARLGYYALALDRLLEHPWSGTGLFTFGRELAAAQSIPPEQPHAHAHNLILNVGAELGLPGSLALGLTGALIAHTLRRDLAAARTRAARLQIAAAAGSLSAIAIHSLVDMPLMAPSLVLAALIALTAGLIPPAHFPTSQGRWRGGNLARLGMTALWIVILAAGWRGVRDNARYTRGQAEVASGHAVSALADLRAAADAQPWNAFYRAEYAYAAGLAAGQGDPGAAAEAVEAYERALRDEPEQALWWANLAAVEWGRGERSAAIQAMRRAVAAAPKAADLWLNLGRYAEEAGDVATARHAYQRSLQLAPRTATAAFWRATPMRRVALARTSGAPFPEAVARRLWVAGDERQAIALLHRTISRDPAQPRPFIEIARLALASGQIERGEVYLDAADVLNPIGADATWTALLRAEITMARGDADQAGALRERARAASAPHRTGYGWMYGADTAQFQFLSLTVPGKLLPQLTVLGSEPAALDAAMRD